VYKVSRVRREGECRERTGVSATRERSAGAVDTERNSKSPNALLSRCITVVEELEIGV
jgi:hypothetical protein